MTLKTKIGILSIFALLLAGCGDDSPSYNAVITREVNTDPVVRPHPAVNKRPSLKSEAETSLTSGDRLVSPDPNSSYKDPLSAGAGESRVDPFVRTTSAMPTEHSHWLRGSIFNARVSVVLNALALGDYVATVNKDITMKCRKGMNTLTIVYTPAGSGSMADIDILESEHNPPLPPLISFKSRVEELNASSGDSQNFITRTYTFNAH
jgi:hypothetical protein